MLVERPPRPRYGVIKVDDMTYKFRVKKTVGMFCHVTLLDYVTEKYVREIFRVPKDLSIGAPLLIAKGAGEEKVCLMRSEVKPPMYWGKALHYGKRKKI